MPTFSAHDGANLAYHVFGEGIPLVCLPGGPMQDSVYFGELGGLSAYRQLIMLDHRGTGASATPSDPATYRCDRLVADVEALRVHLGLEQMDLLSHSGGTNLATLYAAQHPDRVSKLLLITPSSFAVGMFASAADRREVALLRKDEPWFPEAFAALEALMSGNGNADSFAAIKPFWYGRWDEVAQAFDAAQDGHKNDEAAGIYGSEGAYDPEATRAALSTFDALVLLLAGEVDLNSPPSAVAELAGLLPNAQCVVQQGTGHFPWIDDASQFVTTVAAFLRRP